MDFWNSLSGMLEAELVSAKLQWMLRQLSRHGIDLYQIRQEDMVTASFWIRRRDWKRAQAICEEACEKIVLRRKKGLSWKLTLLRKRKTLVMGLILLMLAAMLLPTRILFVRVEGNHVIPSQRILEGAEACGISFGASRQRVRSEKIKNAMLFEIPELQWVGINTSGCVATISVRERTEPEPQTERREVGSIVAERDGFLLSVIGTRGNLMVHAGQTVQAGDILISGYTDCGLTIRAECAEGEFLAQTGRELKVKTPLLWTRQVPTGSEKKKLSIVFGKKRIYFWKDSGISDATCGRMYRKYDISLPGGFLLPVSICMETYYEMTQEPVRLASGDLLQRVQDYAEDYLRGQMLSGTILRGTRHMDTAGDVCEYTGTYVCRELIGRFVREQIGEINGEDS